MQSHQNQKIKNLSLDDRPREKALDKGTQALSNAELIAILLGSGNQKMNAVQLAQHILFTHSNQLNVLAKKSIQELMHFDGIGPAKAVSIAAALELGRRRKLETGMLQDQIVNDSRSAYEILSPNLSDLGHEEFWVLFLNNKNKVLRKQKISEGGMTGTVVDQRLIFKEAILNQATKLILAHNHPSGNLSPSTQDISLTNKMIESGKLMDIQVLDHLIITQTQYCSILDHL